MPLDVWPASLPQHFNVQDFGEGMGDGRVRSDMDKGPAKIRRRSSYVPRPMGGSFRMSADQVLEARRFIDETLMGGSLPFLILDPLTGPKTGNRAMVRIVDMPSWTAVSPIRFSFSFSMEVLLVLAPGETL